MSIEWIDTTSYPRGQRGNVEPNTWEARAAGVRIVVHQYVGCGDDWFLTCPTLDLDRSTLYTTDVDEAKQKALAGVALRLQEHIEALTNALTALKEIRP